ncbi:MAG: FtsX-like permease family protein [Rhodopirellula sp. JB055]|uniref:ABC transporter permease n=1 Tax=Rhodopirellula sp. JB055 TaxID=3342846 RepID=UPI00370AF51C
MKVIRLALAFLRERTTRTTLTTVAIAAAVCMVIWVSSSYEALHKTYDEFSNLALGRYELAIAPISGDEHDFVTPDVLQPLRDDPAVVAVDPMWAKRIAIENSNLPPAVQSTSLGPGDGPRGLLPNLMFMATDAPEAPFDLSKGNWIVSDATSPQVVLRADVAELRQLHLGDWLTVERPRPGADGQDTLALKIVGLLDAPPTPKLGVGSIPMLTPSFGEAFVNVELAEDILSEPFQISLLGVSVQDQADITKFRFGWAPRLNRYETPLQFQEAYEIEEALDQASEAENVKLQSYAATGVAMLVAMLVTFCSLSMGVTERTRQYAVLRAIAFTKRQILSLIVVEGLVLGAMGLVAGIVVGWGLLQIVEVMFGELLHHGILLGSRNLGLAVLASLGGAFLASLLPAYRSTRVKPLDAVAPLHQTSISQRPGWLRLLVGITLIAINPVLTFVFPPSESSVGLAMGIGFLCSSIGFFVIAPSIVVWVDRHVGPTFARWFRIDPKLLASQITSHLWRSVGAAIAMAFGLGLFVGIQVWGFTMLESFIPGKWTPDAVVMLNPGLVPEAARKLANHPDVDPQRCLPMVVEQPRLVEDLTGSAERPSVIRQDNVVMIGLDPEPALVGEHPLLRLEWVAGNPRHAVKQMQEGGACIVPDHFIEETGLQLGDSISVSPPRNADNHVSYVIAGVVQLPGWHWQTKFTGLRTRTHRAAALVIADYDSVASDFDLPTASHVWFSYASDDADVDSIQAFAKNLVEQSIADEPVDPETPSSDATEDELAKVVPVDGIRHRLDVTARRWIWVISYIPLVSLLISCLGVLNVMLASVRSRRWEFGVLRSIGFTSSDLTRAILIEGLLIAFVAGVLSLGFGVLSGWCGSGMAQYMSFFGGLHPPLVIPWLPIMGGFLLVLLLGVGIAAWPAISIGKSRPMELLQSGNDFS